LNFVGVSYYDGQGFMVRKSRDIKSALELNGVTVCTNTGTTAEFNLEDYFRIHKMRHKVIIFERADEVASAYDAGRCDVYTSDQSQLYAQRLKMKNPDDHVILPEVISKEPLGPAVRHGDDEWFDIVKWSLYCMLNAEELGVTSATVEGMVESTNPEIRRLLGVEGDTGKSLGLSDQWCRDIVKQVGNYGESFARNLGPDTPLKIERGLNALWSHGGIMYAPPIR
jgi:general L-amino acid transport system substrate-binding protein